MDLTENEIFEETKCRVPCFYYVYDLLGIQSSFDQLAYVLPDLTTFSKTMKKRYFVYVTIFRILLCSAKE